MNKGKFIEEFFRHLFFNNINVKLDIFRVFDTWNTLVQTLNPVQEIYESASHDYLCDVDDPFGYLANCLDETTLNSLTQTVSQNIFYISKLTVYALLLVHLNQVTLQRIQE